MGNTTSFENGQTTTLSLSGTSWVGDIQGCNASQVLPVTYGVYEIKGVDKDTRGMLMQTCGDHLTGPQRETCASRPIYYNEGNYKCPQYQSKAFASTGEIQELWKSTDPFTKNSPCPCDKAQW